MTEPDAEPSVPPAYPDPAAAAPASAYPFAYPPPAPPRKRRSGLIIGVVLAAVFTLCAGGGVAAFLLVQNAQPRGAAAPHEAIEGFLTAVFADFSAAAAAAHVCPAVRDESELNKLVTQVRSFAERFAEPRTTWEYPPVQASGGQAEATVTLTLRTDFEQVATKQIRLLLVDDRGWWVCDAESA
jgi:hypothetical protein